MLKIFYASLYSRDSIFTQPHSLSTELVIFHVHETLPLPSFFYTWYIMQETSDFPEFQGDCVC